MVLPYKNAYHTHAFGVSNEKKFFDQKRRLQKKIHRKLTISKINQKRQDDKVNFGFAMQKKKRSKSSKKEVLKSIRYALFQNAGKPNRNFDWLRGS